jgi:hypothetical protein
MIKPTPLQIMFLVHPSIQQTELTGISRLLVRRMYPTRLHHILPHTQLMEIL